ncbi:MAG: redoxin domain-containing protein [Myxococcales bacterium]|nr:redoxin domain-containing protein [Myxococcales bacterium]
MLRSLLPIAVGLALVGCDKPKESPDAPPKDSAGAAAPSASPSTKAEPEAKAEPAKPAPEVQAAVGKPAPDFTLPDLNGASHQLSAHRGKWVVLEWFNPECPFVKYAHTDGPLADMAAKEVEQGVVWLAINSGAPGKQGHGVQANRSGASTFGMKHPVLLDEDGAIGHTYGAIKTPHVFLIDPEGVLRYAGAIDNAPIGEVDGGGEYRNHLAAALAEVRASSPVSTPEVPAYGCTVKYAKG